METPASTPASAKKLHTITLDNPVVRGEQTFTDIEVRKPGAGELRGLGLQDLFRADVNSLVELLPRITLLTKPEVQNLDPADLMQLAGEVMDFLLPKAAKESLGL